jgi:hypothetical protein
VLSQPELPSALFGKGADLLFELGIVLDKEICGTEVSPQFITTATDGVAEQLEEWRNRELEAVYPVVFFDAIVVKIRENGHVANRSLHLVGHQSGGRKGATGPLDGGRRRCKELAGHSHQAKEPRGRRHRHRCGGWTDRLSGSCPSQLLAVPTTDAAMKLCFIAIRNISKKMAATDQALEPGAEPPGYHLRRPGTGLKEFTQNS